MDRLAPRFWCDWDTDAFDVIGEPAKPIFDKKSDEIVACVRNDYANEILIKLNAADAAVADGISV
jgi:hypothetical protein